MLRKLIVVSIRRLFENICIGNCVLSTPILRLPALCNIFPPNIRRQAHLQRLYPNKEPLRRFTHTMLKITARTLNAIDFIPKYEGNNGWRAASKSKFSTSTTSQPDRKNFHFRANYGAICTAKDWTWAAKDCNAAMLHKRKMLEEPSCSWGSPHQATKQLLSRFFKYLGALSDLIKL